MEAVKTNTMGELLFEMFKKQLVNFVDKHFSACQDFKDRLMGCKDEESIRKLFIIFRDDVFAELGGDIEDRQDEIDNLEYKLDKLEGENWELNKQLEEINYSNGNTLHDEYKLKFFMEYKDKYTPWELEDLLKNGKI